MLLDRHGVRLLSDADGRHVIYEVNGDISFIF